MSLLKKLLHIHDKSFKRVLGVSDLFSIGYGDLGSSIYYALGITALYALGATPISLMIAGVIFACTALTYAEISSTFPESGGSASFARHAFNDIVSFIAGWGLLLDYIVTIAISAFAIGPYLSYFIPKLTLIPFHLSATIGFIILLLIMNVSGIRQSTRVSFVLMFLALATQSAIIVIGICTISDLHVVWDHLKINIAGASYSPSWTAFWKGTAMAMVAYTGIESIAQLGAEAQKPAKTVPRAIMLTMLVLLLVYLGLSVVAFSILKPEDLGSTYIMNPLVGVVKNLPFGSCFLEPWMGLLAAVILFVATNAGLIGSSRLAYNLGEYYQLPSFFYKLSPRKTPDHALCFFSALAIVIVILSWGSLDFLSDLYNFGAMIAFFFAHLSLIVLRIKQPNIKRPFYILCNISLCGYQIPVSAILGCVGTLSTWVLIVLTKTHGRWIGLSWMTFGIILYLLMRKKQKAIKN